MFPYPIIDAHHHLWDLEAVHYPWLETKGIIRFFGDPEPIQKNYLVADLRSDISSLPVQGSVHIQVGADDQQHLLEAQTVQQMADSSVFANGNSLVNGIVAFCALEDSEHKRDLDALSDLKNFRGVRQIIGRSPAEDKQTGTDSLLSNPNWLNGLRELEKRSLSFDLQLIPDQMQKAAQVFSQVPNLPVALCHCGSPWYRDTKGWAMWKDGLEAIAKLPNSHCKISGLSMFDHNWTVQSLQPIISTVLDIFGPERCMLGSNFPVDKLHTDYLRLWEAYLQITENYSPSLSEEQKKGLFKSNCTKFYRLA